MARLIFTEEDEQLVESLMVEFDPARQLANARMRDLMPAIDWDQLMQYERSP